MTRKMTAVLIALTCLCGMAALPVGADEPTTMTHDSLTYEVLNDSTLQLIGCTDSAITTVTIPAEIDGRKVCVFDACFTDCPDLTEILVEDGSTLKSVDGVLFDDAGKLLSYPCGKSGTYNVPEGTVSIGEKAFANAAGLTEITLPSTLAYVDAEAFAGCTSLTDFGGAVPLTDGSSIKGCTALTSLALKDMEETTQLANLRLEDCTALTQVSIPDCYQLTGTLRVDGCEKLKTLTLPNASSVDSWIILDCAALTDVTFGEFLTAASSVEIGQCPKLTHVDMSEVQGDVIISECDALETLLLPTAFSNVSLDGCKELTTLTFGASDQVYVKGSASEFPALKDVYYYQNVTQTHFAFDEGLIPDGDIMVHCRRSNVDLQNILKKAGTDYCFIEDEITMGDTNQDGELDILDVIILNRTLLCGSQLSALGEIAADFNGDGKPDMVDSLDILKKIVGVSGTTEATPQQSKQQKENAARKNFAY